MSHTAASEHRAQYVRDQSESSSRKLLYCCTPDPRLGWPSPHKTKIVKCVCSMHKNNNKHNLKDVQGCRMNVAKNNEENKYID